jgi:hypothetical protein
MHKFKISESDMDGFCFYALSLYPNLQFKVSKDVNDCFFVLFQGTIEEAKDFKKLIEQNICKIDQSTYASN